MVEVEVEVFPLHKLQLSQSLQRNLGGSRLFSPLDF